MFCERGIGEYFGSGRAVNFPQQLKSGFVYKRQTAQIERELLGSNGGFKREPRSLTFGCPVSDHSSFQLHDECLGPFFDRRSKRKNSPMVRCITVGKLTAKGDQGHLGLC